MSHTRSIQTNSTNVTLIATVYNTDNSVKSDLAYNTTGISIYIQRIGFANGTPLTLSAKVAPESSHVDGQFLNLGGGNISVDIPDAPIADFIGQIRLYGTFTGGTIIGDWYDVVGYDATAVAVGANTTTPPTASAIKTEVETSTILAKEAALASIDSLIDTITILVNEIKSRTDRIPNNPATSEQITSLQSNSPSEAF